VNHPGIRFTITRHNERRDIEAFLGVLTETVSEVRAEVSDSRARERQLEDPLGEAAAPTAVGRLRQVDHV
jgi:hypothetical protein